MSQNIREGGGVPRGRPSSDVTVREMTIDDIYQVYLMGERVFGSQSSPNMFRFWESSEILDLFETDSEFCLVAEVDDELVGFCLGTTIKKKRSAWKYGYLIWLGVSPDCQGKGIGATLAREFQDRAVEDGASMIFIDTQADSDAVKFWKRMGFGHAQDHVFLSKTVTDAEREAMQERMAAHHTLISLHHRSSAPTPVEDFGGDHDDDAHDNGDDNGDDAEQQPQQRQREEYSRPSRAAAPTPPVMLEKSLATPHYRTAGRRGRAEAPLPEHIMAQQVTERGRSTSRSTSRSKARAVSPSPRARSAKRSSSKAR